MKVMCIDEKGQINENMYTIPFGKVVNVIQDEDEADFWFVVEYPKGKGGCPCAYHKKHFAEIQTGLDELELIEQRLCTA